MSPGYNEVRDLGVKLSPCIPFPFRHHNCCLLLLLLLLLLPPLALLRPPNPHSSFYSSYQFLSNQNQRTKHRNNMGCCLSAHYNPTPPYSASDLPTKPSNRSPPPPPPLPDDVKETVKEVLTETQPTPPPPPAKNPIFDLPYLVKDRNFHQQKPLTSNKNSNSRIPPLPPLPSTAEDALEDRAFEIRSRSESMVSTAEDSCSSAPLKTITPRKDGHRNNSGHSHSPAKKPQAHTQWSGSIASSAARKNMRRMSDQSPGRRAIPGPARVVGGPKADPGERSGRRSSSPATRVCRTESGRMTDPSPGHVRRRNGRKGKGKGDELIENPLVSLECFIFL